MTTYPNVTVTPLVKVDPVLGGATLHADLPCIACIFKGEFDRHKESRRATHVVEVSDIVKLPLCAAHAEEFVGDKR